ncbi:MAG: Flp family type IVb pilin [Nitrospirota bacterium]|nr:Flp family type IVb pilin [Nitrospirota bacterium]
MLNAIRRFVKEEAGASAAEYALLVGVISIGILVSVQLLATNITSAITTAAGNILGS